MSRFKVLASLVVPVALATSVFAEDKRENKTADRQRQLEVCTASSLMDVNVTNEKGEEVASVQDIVVNQDGKVRYLILTHGGVLGVGADYIAAPWQALKYNERTKEITLPMTAKQLEKAPTLKKDNYAELHNPEWTAKVNAFFRLENEKEKKGEGAKNAANAHVMRASQIIGAYVHSTHKDEDGEKISLGDVNDLIMTKPGQIDYVVLGHGGTLEIGETNKAIPWSALQMTPRDQEAPMLTLDMTVDKIQTAPTLKQENFNELTDKSFVRQTRTFFGVSDDRKEIEAETEKEQNEESEDN